MKTTLFISFFLIACHLVAQQTTEAITFTFTAEDLSEDKKLLATNNDEIIFQLYRWKGTDVLEEPIAYRQMLFDAKHLSYELTLVLPVEDSTSAFYLYWTEYEFDRSYEQHTAIYRVYHQKINNYYLQRDYLTLRQYLGSDDLLGFKNVAYRDLINEHSIIFEGIQNLEKFKYKIQLTR